MDENKIKEIYTSYAKDLYRYSMFKLNNKDKAEDIVSETFTLFINQMQKSNIQNDKLYLFGIARNLIYKEYKEVKHDDLEEIIESTTDSTDVNFEKKIMDEELTKIIKSELSNLDSKTQEVIILKVWENLKFSEIADLTKLNESTVKLKFYRGIEKLKSLIEAKDSKFQKTYALSLPALLTGIWSIGQSPNYLLDIAKLAAIVSGTISKLDIINKTMTGATTLKTGILSFINTKILIGASVISVGAVGLGAGSAIYINETNKDNSERLEISEQSDLNVENTTTSTPANNNSTADDCSIKKYSNANYPGFEFDYDSCKWALNQEVLEKQVSGTSSTAKYTKLTLISSIDSNSKFTFDLNPNFATGIGPKTCSTPLGYDYVKNDILWISTQENTYSYLYDFVEGKRYTSPDNNQTDFSYVVCTQANKALTNTQQSSFSVDPYKQVLQAIPYKNLNIVVLANLVTSSAEVKNESDEIVKTLKLGANRDASYYDQGLNLTVDVPAGWYISDKSTNGTGFKLLTLQNQNELWFINFKNIATDMPAGGLSSYDSLPGTTYQKSSSNNPRAIQDISKSIIGFGMETGKNHNGTDKTISGAMTAQNTSGLGAYIYIGYGTSKIATIDQLPDFDTILLPILKTVNTL